MRRVNLHDILKQYTIPEALLHYNLIYFHLMHESSVFLYIGKNISTLNSCRPGTNMIIKKHQNTRNEDCDTGITDFIFNCTICTNEI